jgi:UDP-N-acetylmuramate dehydrogenase
MKTLNPSTTKKIQEKFGNHCQINSPLGKYTTANVGGNALATITVLNRNELIETANYCWENNFSFKIFGSGSNILVSDTGFEGVVILNQAKQINIDSAKNPAKIYAESGANLGLVARKAGLAGIGGLEWAATIPGTVGGAVYGNAGAHQSDISNNLFLAEILQQDSEPVFWNTDQMEYSYRSSVLKKIQKNVVILSATFKGYQESSELIQKRMQTFIEYRKNTQPPGASLGSMFKNPEGDYAGRLIEAAGLKGTTIGGVKVSSIHANFFVNTDNATANDYWKLIQLVQKTVFDKFEINLELEIEPIGFPNQTSQLSSDPGR